MMLKNYSVSTCSSVNCMIILFFTLMYEQTNERTNEIKRRIHREKTRESYLNKC